MGLWHGNADFLATLTSALANNSVLASVDDSTGIPTTTEAETSTHFILAEIDDGGVTQANPEIVWLAGRLGGTSVSIEHRGLLGSTIPASWPIGSEIKIINRHEIIDAGPAFEMGYFVRCTGWVSSAASNPFTGRMKFHGGTDPDNATDLAIADQVEGWDIGNIIGQLALGDLVRIKYWLSEVPGNQITAGGVFRPGRRIEFKLDAAPTDNTGWWNLDIDSTHYFVHDDLPNTTDGRTGLCTIDFVKLV